MTRKISFPALEVPARRIKEIMPPTYGEIIIVIRLFRMLQGRRPGESKGGRGERKGEEEGSLWMDHGFLCPSGVYSVDEALVMAVDARVLMDMPDTNEKKKCGFSLGIG